MKNSGIAALQRTHTEKGVRRYDLGGIIQSLTGGGGGASLLGIGADALGLSPLEAALGVGGLSMLSGNSGMQSILGAAGAYGGASVGQGLQDAGTQAATLKAQQDAVTQGLTDEQRVAAIQAAAANPSMSAGLQAAAGNPLDFLKNNKSGLSLAALSMLGGNAQANQMPTAASMNKGVIDNYTGYRTPGGGINYNLVSTTPAVQSAGGGLQHERHFAAGGQTDYSVNDMRAAITPVMMGGLAGQGNVATSTPNDTFSTDNLAGSSGPGYNAGTVSAMANGGLAGIARFASGGNSSAAYQTPFQNGLPVATPVTGPAFAPLQSQSVAVPTLLSANNQTPTGATPAPSGSDSAAVYNYLMGNGPNPYDPQYLQGANNPSIPAQAPATPASTAQATSGASGTTTQDTGQHGGNGSQSSQTGNGPLGTTATNISAGADNGMNTIGNLGAYALSKIGLLGPMTQPGDTVAPGTNAVTGPVPVSDAKPTTINDSDPLGSFIASLPGMQPTAPTGVQDPAQAQGQSADGKAPSVGGDPNQGNEGMHSTESHDDGDAVGGYLHKGKFHAPAYASGGALAGRGNFFGPSGGDRFHGAHMVNAPHPEVAPAMGGINMLAHGGIAALRPDAQYHLGSYSDGGRLLKGPGDGVSDDIPATIGHGTPARLADGEFVIPARIVSELGNGSTDAGAKRLYQMMARIQAGRKKTIGKNAVATDSKAEKHLPA